MTGNWQTQTCQSFRFCENNSRQFSRWKGHLVFLWSLNGCRHADTVCMLRPPLRFPQKALHLAYDKTKKLFWFWFCCCIILLYHILSCFWSIFSVNSNFLWIKVVHLMKDRSSHRRWSVIRFAFKNVANFTGKHLCGIPIFHKVAGGD